MISVYRRTSDPDYVDNEILTYEYLSYLIRDAYSFPLDTAETLLEMATELSDNIEDWDNSAMVKRHLGNDTVLVMEWTNDE